MTPHPASASPADSPLARPDGYLAVEVEIARTADLVLKVARLLERAQGREPVPERAARMARLSWVVEHGQVALQRAAVDAAGDAVPRPRGEQA